MTCLPQWLSGAVYDSVRNIHMWAFAV